MKIKKIISIIIVAFILIIINSTVFAANLNLNVYFDGKKIEMTSETPEMEWSVNNIVPGQIEETNLTINSIGSKEVKVELSAKIIEGEDVANILKIKILNNKTNEILYDGIYSEIPNINLKIPAKETNSLKIIAELPYETGNELQNKKCIVKFNFVAKGEKETGEKNSSSSQFDSLNTTNEEQDGKKVEEIITDIINPIQTGESYTIYIVLVILVTAFVILFISFYRCRK